jgi:mRNA interferase YafQ
MGLLVANEGPLAAEWRDHSLKGDWEGFRECHAGGDLLLIYLLRDSGQTVIFVRTGCHSELFR